MSRISDPSREGFVENDGVRIHYRAAGQGPLLILVHGFPDNSESFKALVPKLASQYTVVCPSLRGFPPSDIPDGDEEYDLAKSVSDLLAILGHFKAEKAIFGGHDFGAAAVQLVALVKPEFVFGLILLNPPIIPRIRQLVNFDPGQQEMSKYTIKFMEYKEGDDRDVVNKTTFIRDPVRRQEVQDYLSTCRSINGMMAMYRRNYPAPPYGQTADTSSIKFHVPTLIVWGVEDEYFSSKMVDDIPSIFLGPTRLVTIPGAGHWPFQEQPDRVNKELFSWLRELEAESNVQDSRPVA